ncbi:hypothetical protein ATANTOWER_020144 [Ataeniobius toweri]|uniref:Secreted protein n=1 Tax=Ataeniobius toweri TaxID=208326 RepID=A0ABU7B804_9TELE|nr:hypothetical protein [Ataeniobius toweri]
MHCRGLQPVLIQLLAASTCERPRVYICRSLAPKRSENHKQMYLVPEPASEINHKASPGLIIDLEVIQFPRCRNVFWRCKDYPGCSEMEK